MNKSVASLNSPPLGLSREEAAQHIGIGTTLFDEMVTDGRMPCSCHLSGALLVRDDDD